MNIHLLYPNYLKYTIKANPSPNGNGFAFNLFGDPDGNRTHDTTVKGWCLNRLTTGPFKLVYFITVLWVCQAYEREFSRGIDF